MYVGITSDLIKRVFQHKHKLMEGFTCKYDVHALVHYEIFENINDAITREKQLKKWNREWKINLIEKENPEWHDLYEGLNPL